MMKKTFLFLHLALIIMGCEKDNPKNVNGYLTGPLPFPFAVNGTIGAPDNSAILSFDSSLVICGNYENKVRVMRVSKNGNDEWIEDFKINWSCSASGIAEAVNGDLFVCGQTTLSQANSKSDVLLIKLDAFGDIIWTRSYGGSEYDMATNIIFTSDGNLLLCGRTLNFGADTTDDVYVLKINVNGDTLWTKTYPAPEQEDASNILELQNGGFLITGFDYDNGAPGEIFMLKISNDGIQEWLKQIGPRTWKSGNSTIESANGDLVLCGHHGATGKIIVLKTDPVGTVIWEKEYGTSQSQAAYAICQNYDSTYTIAGSTYNWGTGKAACLMMKLDSDGIVIWSKEFKPSSSSDIHNVIKGSNDDNIITGNYEGHIYMTVTDTHGNEYAWD